MCRDKYIFSQNNIYFQIYRSQFLLFREKATRIYIKQKRSKTLECVIEKIRKNKSDTAKRES